MWAPGRASAALLRRRLLPAPEGTYGATASCPYGLLGAEDEAECGRLGGTVRVHNRRRAGYLHGDAVGERRSDREDGVVRAESPRARVCEAHQQSADSYRQPQKYSLHRSHLSWAAWRGRVPENLGCLLYKKVKKL